MPARPPSGSGPTGLSLCANSRLSLPVRPRTGGGPQGAEGGGQQGGETGVKVRAGMPTETPARALATAPRFLGVRPLAQETPPCESHGPLHRMSFLLLLFQVTKNRAA